MYIVSHSIVGWVFQWFIWVSYLFKEVLYILYQHLYKEHHLRKNTSDNFFTWSSEMFRFRYLTWNVIYN